MGPKITVADCHDAFVELVAKKAPAVSEVPRPEVSTVDRKQSSAANGLETATFTVCARIRPVLEHDTGSFACVFPGPRGVSKADKEAEAAGGIQALHTERAVLLNPKISMRQQPEVVANNFTLDYVFGTSESELFLTAAPLLERAGFFEFYAMSFVTSCTLSFILSCSVSRSLFMRFVIHVGVWCCVRRENTYQSDAVYGVTINFDK